MIKKLIYILILGLILVKEIPVHGQELTLNTIKDKDNLKAGISSVIEVPEYFNGWLLANSNFRAESNKESEIIKILFYGEEVLYYPISDEWSVVKHKENIGYVHSSLISNVPIPFDKYAAPVNTLKSFMSYKAITSVTSEQYKLQQIAYTGNYGIRQVNGRYCIAVGSAYTTEIGTYIDVILENGIIIPCILADCKDDKDTDISNRITHDGSLVEFITEVPNLSKTVKYTGDISVVCEDWESMIVGLKIYDRKEEY